MNTSSQKTIPNDWALDLVTDVTFFLLSRRTQYSKAARIMRSVPRRVNMFVCTTVSWAVPA